MVTPSIFPGALPQDTGAFALLYCFCSFTTLDTLIKDETFVSIEVLVSLLRVFMCAFSCNAMFEIPNILLESPLRALNWLRASL
jgi:hypothetical protein